MVEQITRALRVGLEAVGPLTRSGIDCGVEDVGEVVGQRREVAVAHVERDRDDTCRGQPVPVGLFAQSRGAPYLVAPSQRAGDRKGDLAGRTGDEDFSLRRASTTSYRTAPQMLST